MSKLSLMQKLEAINLELDRAYDVDDKHMANARSLVIMLIDEVRAHEAEQPHVLTLMEDMLCDAYQAGINRNGWEFKAAKEKLKAAMGDVGCTAAGMKSGERALDREVRPSPATDTLIGKLRKASHSSLHPADDTTRYLSISDIAIIIKEHQASEISVVKDGGRVSLDEEVIAKGWFQKQAASAQKDVLAWPQWLKDHIQDTSPKRESGHPDETDRRDIANSVMVAMQMLDNGDYITPWDRAVTIVNTVFEGLNIPITKIEGQKS